MTKKKRFTFADAKDEIKELKNQVKNLIDDATLNQDNNVYDSVEQKFIKFYQYGFWGLLVLTIIRFFI